MRLQLILLVTVCVVPFAPAQVVVNEFVYDDSSADDREFVELYNAGPDPVDISLYTVENIDDGGPNFGSPVTIPAGTILPSCGFWVIGDGVANQNQAMSSGWLQNSKESVVLKDSSGVILDAVAYETNKSTTLAPNVVEGGGIWGNFTSIDTTVPMSWSRWIDGRDTDDNGADFGQIPMTPGASNNISTFPAFSDNFDGTAPETAVAGWNFSFVAPTVVDPTTASASLVNPVGASPQGGNAMVAWDPAGGGNAAFLNAAPAQDMTLECYVHLSTFTHAGTEQEGFSIGVRGTTGTYHNLPVGFTANGNTGIAWVYRNDNTGTGTLELRDEGVGGAETVLATFTITSGVNDGWQRLRIDCSGTTVTANFGGTYGMPGTGVVGPFAIASATIGQAYIGFREAVSGTTNAHPVMVDALDISAVASYQVNQPGASLTIDCAQGSIFAPAVATVPTNSAGRVDIASTSVALPWDMGISFEALDPAVITAFGNQIINIDVLFPILPIVWLNGGSNPDLITTSLPSAAFTLNFVTGAAPGTASAQAVMIDPTNPAGISLSAGGQLDVQ